MGYLQHNTGAVASLVVGALGPAVTHILEHLEGVVYQVMALIAMDVDNHAHATGVVLVVRVVQSFAHSILCKITANSRKIYRFDCKITNIVTICYR